MAKRFEFIPALASCPTLYLQGSSATRASRQQNDSSSENLVTCSGLVATTCRVYVVQDDEFTAPPDACGAKLP
ncbi:hypothetical protein BDZ91DRAFT_751366 [Kalaharituber pfeilii]|nr:hypothetical protein BDZ91DRAFT_751366 [Kalaharituber pfeilii]